MEISVMAGVAPARLQQATHALDARSSHNLSSATFVRRTSKTSLLLCLHRDRYPSLHSQLPNWRLRQICAASSKEADEVELTTGEEKGESSNVRRNYFQEGRSRNSVQYRQSDDGPSSRLNNNALESRDSQRRHPNSRNQRLTSPSRRGSEMEGKGGHSSTNRNETPKPNASKYSQYDTEGNMHRAPWDQGPVRGAKANPRGRRSPTPKNKDARGDRENYQGGGQRASMARIVEKLRAIGNGESATTMDFDKNPPATETSAFLPRPGQAVHPGLDRRWSNSDLEQPSDDLRSEFPWAMGEDEEQEDYEQLEKKKRVKSPSVAELTLPEPELRRLRTLGLKLQGQLKIGRLGVTPGIVEAIHDRWRTSELAKVKCDAPLSMNMKKAHEDLERLTGGLVVWRAGSAAVVYRGKDYVHPFVRERVSLDLNEDEEQELFMEAGSEEEMESSIEESFDVTGDQSAEKEFLMKQGQNADLMMMEELLDGLGPKYADWKGKDPVPVDGDLLLNPEFKFKRPFRLLPHGVKPKLNDFEMTQLRRLARPVPPHFVLGRNKGLDGLAAAIVKLWEKSEIVKIGVKKGVQNTSNEKMAEELKKLTGGTLLARDKEYIVLSRGKDFLPSVVRVALEERDRMAKEVQEEEERIRLSGRKRVVQVVDTSKVGTLEEAMETRAAWEGWQNSDEARKERIAARKAKRAQAMDKIRQKMKLALQKKERAVADLAKIDAKTNSADAPLDKEYLSEAEKYMYRQQGLKHKGYLLLGRRGVFGGTVENMHLHWKHRELVKILVKAPIAEAQQTAKMLERESGGILVDIVNTSKGQAIIVYRGKNYQRPSELRPRHLLTKRQALKRSLEVQRMQSLEKHIQILMKEIETMQAGLKKMEEQDELENEAGTQGNLEDFDATDFNLDDVEKSIQDKNFFKAEPLTRKQRQHLRQQIPLMLGRTANFNIGKTTVYEDLAKSICAHLQKHPFVKVGVKGRPKGSSVASVVEQIEEHTGAVLLSTEPSKLIFYRGWLAGEERPDLAAYKKGGIEDELSSDRRGLSDLDVESEDEDEDDFDDFGIDAWNDEDWEGTAEDEEVTHEEKEGELRHEDATWS